jgi:hypothetical protein
MIIHEHRDGAVEIIADNNDDDSVVVIGCITAFHPVRNALFCTCGVALGDWALHCMPRDGGELCCPACHRSLARFSVGAFVQEE